MPSRPCRGHGLTGVLPPTSAHDLELAQGCLIGTRVRAGCTDNRDWAHLDRDASESALGMGSPRPGCAPGPVYLRIRAKRVGATASPQVRASMVRAMAACLCEADMRCMLFNALRSLHCQTAHAKPPVSTQSAHVSTLPRRVRAHAKADVYGRVHSKPCANACSAVRKHSLPPQCSHAT